MANSISSREHFKSNQRHLPSRWMRMWMWISSSQMDLWPGFGFGCRVSCASTFVLCCFRDGHGKGVQKGSQRMQWTRTAGGWTGGKKSGTGRRSDLSSSSLIALALLLRLSSTQAQFVAHLNIPSENKCKFSHGKHTHTLGQEHIGHRQGLLLLLLPPLHISRTPKRCSIFPVSTAHSLLTPAHPSLSTYLYKFSIFCFNSLESGVL